MINSFRRTGDGEADGGRGSGRGTGKRTEAAAAVRAVRLFGRRRLSSPAWPAASGAKPPPAPRKAHWRAERSPTAAGASSFLFLVLLFLRLSPVGGSGWKPSHRRRQNPPSCAAKTAAGGSAGRTPAARRQNPPHTARSSSPAARRQSPPALQDVVQLDTAAGMRLFSALQETNPPPRPQAFGWSGSISEGEGSKTAADVQLFGLQQGGNVKER